MEWISIVLSIFIILLLLWIYYFQYRKIHPEKVFLDEILPSLKTGDLILFKAMNNFNAIAIGSYFTHIGVVYVIDDIPYLFEANGVEFMALKPHHSRSGIFLTPVRERIQKYKGFVYLKRLQYPINSCGFDEFVTYCLDNFYYDQKIIRGNLSRWLSQSGCCSNTDCGQLAFLSLIKLGLLDESEYDNSRLHYLKYVCGLVDVKDNSYRPLLEIIDQPFAV